MEVRQIMWHKLCTFWLLFLQKYPGLSSALLFVSTQESLWFVCADNTQCLWMEAVVFSYCGTVCRRMNVWSVCWSLLSGSWGDGKLWEFVFNAACSWKLLKSALLASYEISVWAIQTLSFDWYFVHMNVWEMTVPRHAHVLYANLTFLCKQVCSLFIICCSLKGIFHSLLLIFPPSSV